MGAIHTPIPLTKIIKDNEGIEWLESIGITIPDVDIWSNQPKMNYLKLSIVLIILILTMNTQITLL
jgi:hypothetical protein